MDKVTKINSLEKNKCRITIPNKFRYIPLLVSLAVTSVLATGDETNTNNQNGKEQPSIINIQETQKEKIGSTLIEETNKIFLRGNIKASQESIDIVVGCLQKYEKYPKVVGEITFRLGQTAFETKNSIEVLKVAILLSSKEVFDCISKFEKIPEAARVIAFHFGLIASLEDIASFKEYDKLSAVQYIPKKEPYQKLGEVSIQRCDPSIKETEEIKELRRLLEYYTRIEAEVRKTAKLFSSEVIFNCISKFEKTPEVAGEITDRLESIANYTESKKAVIAAAKCISKYENFPEVAKEIAYSLGKIDSNTYSEKAVIKAAKKISNAKTPEEAVRIAQKLVGISTEK